MKVKRNQLQPLYHLLMGDLLRIEYAMDFEDLKETAMHLQVMTENDCKLAQMMEKQDADLHEYFADRFLDNPDRKSSQIST